MDSPRSRRNTTSRLRATLQRWPAANGPIVDGFDIVPGKPVDSVDGLSPPSLTTGASATSARSISRLMTLITPVSSRTNSCPEKPGAAHRHPLEQRRGIVGQRQQAARFLREHRADGALWLVGAAPVCGGANAPGLGLGIEVIQINEAAGREEGIPDVADGALDAALLVAAGDRDRARFVAIV